MPFEQKTFQTYLSPKKSRKLDVAIWEPLEVEHWRVAVFTGLRIEKHTFDTTFHEKWQFDGAWSHSRA